MESMTLPATTKTPRVRGVLRFYRITAYITGVLLLLLTVEMVLKYAFLIEIEAFGPFGFIAAVPDGTATGLNLSRWVLIVHGWFYVVYLVASYLLWQTMRWKIGILLAMAAGGVVPFLSFVTEHFMTRRVRRELEFRAEAEAQVAEEDARLAAFEASLTPAEREELDAAVAARADQSTAGAARDRD